MAQNSAAGEGQRLQKDPKARLEIFEMGRMNWRGPKRGYTEPLLSVSGVEPPVSQDGLVMDAAVAAVSTGVSTGMLCFWIFNTFAFSKLIGLRRLKSSRTFVETR